MTSIRCKITDICELEKCLFLKLTRLKENEPVTQLIPDDEIERIALQACSCPKVDFFDAIPKTAVLLM